MQFKHIILLCWVAFSVIILFATKIAQIKWNRKLGSCKAKTIGTVIRYDTSYTTNDRGEGEPAHCAIIEYEAQGAKYIYSGNEGDTMPHRFNVGDHITIRYNPKNPETAISTEYEGNGMFLATYLSILIMFVFVSIFIILL